MLYRLAALLAASAFVGLAGCTSAENVAGAPNQPDNPWFDVAITGSPDDASYAANANPNVRGARGRTPLIEATWQGKAGAVDLLLSNDADPNLTDSSGQTPLQYATRNNNDRTEIVDMLLAAGADPDAAGSPYPPPLCHAASHGRVDQLDMLLAAGADLNAADRKGRDAAWYARRYSEGEALRFLKNAELAGRDGTVEPTSGETTNTDDSSGRTGGATMGGVQ